MPALSFSKSLIELASRLTERTAPDQGGLLTGQNIAAVNTSDPLRLWVIQIGIIVCFTQALALALGRIRQPKVIAEVIGGILLGPSVMGHVPGFTANIFPPLSVPYLNLTANIGLVLFLFLVGLEVDTRIIRRNARSALSVSAAGMILPFGMGAALAVPMYHKFINTAAVSFGHYLLFAGVAMSITAFPVLCRILTELQLLNTTVGNVVLAAGVGNDVVGWILLALTVALVNAGTGIEALYVLLVTVAWALVLLFPIKWGFVWLARKTGSFENGPTPFMMTFTLLLVFVSAFLTDVVGVHAIFGGFLAGLMIPHEGNFNIALVEKFEDLVSLLFLPLYFAYSGLNTNLGLLDEAIDWGYIVALCTIAFIGKFSGCCGAAYLCGFNWRESSAIGTMMSCKGLVELIVLNVGLQAGILDTRIFSMFVLEALVLTFMTTPLTLAFYPPKYHVRDVDHEIKAVQHPDNEKGPAAPKTPKLEADGEDVLKTRFTVVLNKMEHLPALMTLTQLLQPPPSHRKAIEMSTASLSSKNAEGGKETASPGAVVPTLSAASSPTAPSTPRPEHQVTIDALRLIELTDRASALMKSSVTDDLIRSDTLVNVFRTYGHLNRIPVSASLAVVNYDSFPASVAAHAEEHAADLVIVPWGPQAMGSAVLEQDHVQAGPTATTTYSSPFANLFNPSTPTASTSADVPTSSLLYSQLTRRIFMDSPSDVALFVDRGLAPSETGGGYGQHIFLPFFGGPDDRLALTFVVQLCAHPAIGATVVRVTKSDEPTGTDLSTPAPTHTTDMVNDKAEALAATFGGGLTIHSSHAYPDTMYGHATTQTRLASDAADNIVWERFAASAASGPARSAFIESALSRITFADIKSSHPLHALIQRAKAEETAKDAGMWKSLLIVVGRARRLAVESHEAELQEILLEQGSHSGVNSDIRKTIGDVASAFVVSGSKASLLVMQSAESRPE